MKVYGIKNCNTVKKARAWLELHDIDYEFIDFKKSPPSADDISRWCTALGVDTVLNRHGTTWKKLAESKQVSVDIIQGAIATMVANPSVIKRPIIEVESEFLIGFDEGKYQSHFL